MKRIETTRKFLVKPNGLLYFNAKPNCDHSEYFGLLGRNMGNCPACLGCLGNSEFIGERAVFETDELTESKIVGIYFANLFIDANFFKIIEEK